MRKQAFIIGTIFMVAGGIAILLSKNMINTRLFSIG